MPSLCDQSAETDRSKRARLFRRQTTRKSNCKTPVSALQVTVVVEATKHDRPDRNPPTNIFRSPIDTVRPAAPRPDRVQTPTKRMARDYCPRRRSVGLGTTKISGPLEPFVWRVSRCSFVRYGNTGGSYRWRHWRRMLRPDQRLPPTEHAVSFCFSGLRFRCRGSRRPRVRRLLGSCSNRDFSNSVRLRRGCIVEIITTRLTIFSTVCRTDTHERVVARTSAIIRKWLENILSVYRLSRTLRDKLKFLSCRGQIYY